EGAAAVEHHLRALDDLDALHVDEAVVHEDAATGAADGLGGDVDAVDEDGDVLASAGGGEAADRDAGVALAGTLVELDAGQLLGEIGDAGDVLAFDRLFVDGVDGDRNFLQAFLAFPRGDDDFLDLAPATFRCQQHRGTADESNG